jgi:hypothetical protein
MNDWMEENFVGVFFITIVCLASLAAYNGIRLQERKLDIMDKHGCSTIVVDK